MNSNSGLGQTFLDRTRRLLFPALLVLFASCGGGGNDTSTAPTDSKGSVEIAPGSQIEFASVGDDEQVIYVMPGEMTARRVRFRATAEGANVIVAIDSGKEILSLTEQDGTKLLLIDSTLLNGGESRDFRVSVNNQSTGTGAVVSGHVRVLSPAVIGGGVVSSAGATIADASGNVVIDFGAMDGAPTLNVTMMAADVPGGGQQVRLKFDRDVSTDGRLITVRSMPSPVVSAVSANTSERGKHLAAAQSFPWKENLVSIVGAFVPVWGFRIDGIPMPLSSKAVLCETSGFALAILNKACFDSRVAWSLDGDLAKSASALKSSEPVLFVHGFNMNAFSDFGSGLGGGLGTWGTFPEMVSELLPASDATKFSLFEFRWDTNADFQQVADNLADAVALLHGLTGRKVHVIAHSFGGNVIRTMLQEQVNRAVKKDAYKHVLQVITLGTPHSGIFGGAAFNNTGGESYYNTTFFNGRDSSVLQTCVQVSCYQMGVHSAAVASYAALLGTTWSFGETAGRLASADPTSGSNFPLPTGVPITSGKGFAQDFAIGPASNAQAGTNVQVVGTKYRDGDGLISSFGQKFLPTKTLGPCDAQLGPLISEVLLDGEDGRTPGLALPLPVARKGYSHSAVVPLMLVGGGETANVREANIDNCTKAATSDACVHASFKLVRKALEVGTCVQFPRITKQPQSVDLQIGQSATFSVEASGTQPLQYQWRLNGAAIAGAISATYTTQVTAAGNFSQFSVVVSNSVGSKTSAIAELTVAASTLRITTDPLPATTVEGGAVTFKVAANTNELVGILYQWRLGSLNLTDGQNFVCGSPMTISGATTDTLTLSGVPLGCNGYQVSALARWSQQTASSKQAALTVTASPMPGSAPVVTSVSPTAMIANGLPQLLTINGGGFTAASVVQFKWLVDPGARIWTISASPSTLLSATQITVPMNPGKVTDTISVRVCPSTTRLADTDCSAGTAAVQVAPLPPPTATADLLPMQTGFTPTAVTAGASIQVSFAIKNQGAGSAAASIAAVRINQSASSSGASNAGSLAIPTLASGSSTGVLTLSVATPAAAGTYRVWVVADTGSAAGQATADTINDAVLLAASLTVSAVQTGPQVTSFVMSPATPSVGVPVVFTITGANLPPAPTLSFPGCAGYVLNGWTATTQQFGCTPTQAGTNMAGSIVASTGTVLYSFNVTVNPIVPAVGTSGLFVGYYSEDPTARNPNSNDLPHYSLLYINVPASGSGFTGVMDAKLLACQIGADIATISGSKSGANITGTWSGTFDAVAQSGSFTGTYNAASLSYYGDYTVSGGLQLIPVPSCGIQYSVYPKGTWEALPVGGGSPVTFTLQTSGLQVTWVPEAGTVMTMISVIDEQDALGGATGAVKYLNKSVQGPASFNLGAVAGLVAGRTYLVSVTTATTYSQRTGSSIVRVVR